MATIVLQVSASTDDARNINGGTSKVTNAVTQHIGKFSTTDYWNGFRWENVGIPQGAKINSAYLDLYSAQIASGSTAKAIFYGVAEDNAATFNTSTEYPEGKPRTTASVTKDFNVSLWSSNPGFGVELVDVTAIVQEIINRPGWQEGNALAIVCHDNGSANNNYIGHSTYDRASDRGARLIIDYTMATLEYLQSAESGSDRFRYTFSSQNLGTADADRYIIVAIGGRKAGASTNVISVTVAGVYATIIINDPASLTNTGYVGIAIARVPTGTIGDVVVTFSDTMVCASIALYRATGIIPDASAILEMYGNSLTGNIDVTDGGVTVGVATNSANNAFTWTGLTEDVDQNTTGKSTYRFTAASAVEGTTTTKTVTASATDMSSEAALGVVHFEAGGGGPLNQAPTVVLDTPDKHVFNTPTPKLEFTGTDPDGDDISYNVGIYSFRPEWESENIFRVLASSEAAHRRVGGFTDSGTSGIALHSGISAAQIFEADIDVNDTSVIVAKLRLRRVGSGGSYFIFLTGLTEGEPDFDSPLGGMLDTVAFDDITTDPNGEWVKVWLFADPSFTINASGQYALWMFDFGGADPSNHIEWLYAPQGSYPHNALTSNDYGDSWSDVSGQALQFELHKQTFIEATSDVSPGFVNEDNNADTDPFTSGDKISFTPNLELPEDTYYWDVIGMDPGGTGEAGVISETRKFFISLGPSFNPAIARRRLLL